MSKWTARLIIVGIAASVALIGFFVMWLFFLHTETVEPGHHLVINDKPYFFGHEGVRAEPLTEGRIMLFRTSSTESVRMTPQSTPIKVDDFSSKDNILLDFETTVQWKVTDAVSLVKNFGASDWLNNNLRNQYLALVRDSVKKYAMSDMMSDIATAQAIDNEVTDGIRKLVADEKLPVIIMNVSLGRAKPNEEVLRQMNDTAAQQQRQKTLIAATQAEKQREEEQIAKAKADNAYRKAMDLSPEQFIQLESIKRYSEACLKSTCVIGQVPITLAK